MVKSKTAPTESYPSFGDLLKNPDVANATIDRLYKELKLDGTLAWILKELARESHADYRKAYPGQGLVVTGYEGDGPVGKLPQKVLPTTAVRAALRGWLYYLQLFNHPSRLKYLYAQSGKTFVPPQAAFHPLFFFKRLMAQSVTIKDIKLNATGSQQPRVQRTEAHRQSLFVSYRRPWSWWDRVQNWVTGSQVNPGRWQARNVVVGAANPEVTGSPMALASLAQAHSLVCVPRDGFFSDIKRQVALVEKTHQWLERSPILEGKKPKDRAKLLEFWRHNLMGVLEANTDKAPERVTALYNAGLRTFRIYSPEPSSVPLETLKLIRTLERQKKWEPIEIFVGQVVDVQQARDLEAAGANALYFGIGGGGRCITGVVAGLSINWPELIWKLRGQVKIPLIVEGGANDHMPESLAIGASGIGTAGKFCGTIETPGGYRYLVDEKNRLFKYYGGEASDRMRVMAGRSGPLGFVLNREGETRRKRIRNGGHDLPTLLQVLYEQQQGIVAGLVFQNARSISEFQEISTGSLRQGSIYDDDVRQTH